MKFFAHRGASGHYPENTMISFEKAIEFGAVCFEFDVQRTKDGKMVVCHDEEISRVSNGSGLVENIDYEELILLNFGTQECKQTIPLLVDVLALFKAGHTVNVELKNVSAREYVMDVYEIMSSYKDVDYIVSSFKHEYIDYLKICNISGSLNILYAYLFKPGTLKPKDVEAFVTLKQPDCINIYKGDIWPRLVRHIHKQKVNGKSVQIGTYTVNSFIGLKLCKWLKVENVYTNFVELQTRI